MSVASSTELAFMTMAKVLSPSNRDTDAREYSYKNSFWLFIGLEKLVENPLVIMILLTLLGRFLLLFLVV